MKASTSLQGRVISTVFCCTCLIGSVPAMAGLIGTTAILDPYYQETPEGEIWRLDEPLTAVVTEEIEFPCLNCLVDGFVEASIDVGDDYFESVFAGRARVGPGYKNFLELSFEASPPIEILSAELDPVTTLDVSPSNISIAGNKLIIDVSHGPLYDPGTILRINLSTQTVPEPSALLLIAVITPFCTYGFYRRNRR
ncbi:hypothetical protein NG895_14485 [Aeoliella sp. ICT_H6.2]|uniref:PEP-CTERM protein-sorting domain-containing protein n=1 Tax=Aeoliella straminimaris TaxID=2954799 RepID=A0A9X2JGJ7_9BACT|nr:hypothetical protein [Aeoliella straminimaris]MCO6045115.1 hypothetical protein [Aeoliella straminimaris]